MSDTLPIDAYVGLIRKAHDVSDYHESLAEFREAYGAHAQNPGEIKALEKKLVDAGLMNDLALEWGKDKFAHNFRGPLRSEIEEMSRGNDPIDRLMASQIDNNWKSVSSYNAGEFLSIRQINDELHVSDLITDAKSLLKPFRDDPGLFEKLIAAGKTDEITPDGLRPAVRPDNDALTQSQKLVAQRLLDKFDSDAMRVVESGFIWHQVTKADLNTFLQNNPDPPEDAVTPAAAPDARVQQTAATATVPEPPLPSPTPDAGSPPSGPPTNAAEVSGPAASQTQPTETLPANPQEVAARAASATSQPPDRGRAPAPNEVATASVAAPGRVDAPVAGQETPQPPSTTSGVNSFSNKLNAGDGPYQSFRAAHPDWTSQRVLDAAHQVKKQLGREEFRQGEQFKINPDDNSVTSRREDRKKPGAYTETTGKDGHTIEVKTGDASGNWTDTTFDASGKPTGSIEHKVAADGWTETAKDADGKPTSSIEHKTKSDGTAVERKTYPDKPSEFEETNFDNNQARISGSRQQADGTKGTWVRNSDNTVTVTLDNAKQTSTGTLDLQGKIIKQVVVDKTTQTTVTIEQKDGKWVKITHTGTAPDTVENLDGPPAQPPTG